jgi:hypothetical protein
MINRRFDGRASGPARNSPKQPLQRKPRIYLPATLNGGHESGLNDTEDSQIWAWCYNPGMQRDVEVRLGPGDRDRGMAWM